MMGRQVFVKGRISNTHYDPRWYERLSAEGKAALEIAAKRRQTDFDGYLKILGMTPEGPLRGVLKEFYRLTPVALELPFYSFLFYTAAYLVKKGVYAMVGGRKVHPYVWLVLLARSGGFKSFSNGQIKSSAPVKENIEGFESDAKMIEMMAANEENGEGHVMIIDEFLQTLKKIENDGGPMAGCKTYFLRSYDGAEISRRTKASDIVVRDASMNFLGINVYETFLQGMTAESMLDGFSQRFSYVVASDTTQEENPRDARDGRYTEINEAALKDAVKKAWDLITSQPILAEYKRTDEMLKVFSDASDAFKSKYPNVPVSFFVRERFRLYSYALIIHFLRGKGGEEYLDATDAEYAVLLFERALDNLSKILRDMNPDNIFDKIERLVEMRGKFETKHPGKPFQLRDVIAGFAGKVKLAEARDLWTLAFDDMPPEKKKASR